jgi:hypothetical protein
MADNENSVPPEQIEFLKWLEDNRFSQFRENSVKVNVPQNGPRKPGLHAVSMFILHTYI